MKESGKAPGVVAKVKRTPKQKVTTGKSGVLKAGRSAANKLPMESRPTHDKHGFEIDYKKVDACKRRPRRKSPQAYMRMLEEEQKEGDRKAFIMGTVPAQVSAVTLMAWADRVARELGKAYHKVVMEDFEEIHRRGLKFRPGEFEAKNIPKEEQDRISDMATGSAFRK